MPLNEETKPNQTDGFNYYDLTQIFQFNINPLFAHSKVVSSIAI